MGATVLTGTWGRWAAGVGLGLLLAGTAPAQTLIPASGVEFDDAEIFKPTVDPGPFLSIYDSRTLAPGRFSLGGYLDYALESMDGRRRIGGSEENEAVVDNTVALSFLGALGLTPRIQVGARLPFYLVDEADVILGTRSAGGTSVNFGDFQLNGKIDLLGSLRGFGLALLPEVGLPTGNRRGYAGTGKFTYGGLLAADWRGPQWIVGANVGGMIRDGFGGRDEDDALEDQIRWGLAASRTLGERWAVIGEVNGLTDASEEFHSPVEILGAARWAAGPVDLTFGAGGGVSSGKNAALFRLFVGVTAPLADAFAPGTAAPRAARPRTPSFAGPEELSSSRKTYVVEDHDRNGQVSAGDVIVYTITILNDGVEAARNVLMVDPIPANTDFVPGSILVNGLPMTDTAGYTVSPPQVVVRLASIGAGAINQTTITFKVRIRSTLTTAETIRNEVRISGDGLGSFTLPAVETSVFPAAAQRENVVQTTPTEGGKRKLEVTENIQFEPASATIVSDSYPVLDQVASILREQTGMHLRIVGHTDDSGDEFVNLGLSERRAQEVKNYLAQAGVDPDRLDASGRGEYEPVAGNETAAGRAANRRVEFIVLRP